MPPLETVMMDVIHAMMSRDHVVASRAALNDVRLFIKSVRYKVNYSVKYPYA